MQAEFLSDISAESETTDESKTCQQWTLGLLPEVSPVSQPVSQENDLAQQMTAGSGRRLWPEALAAVERIRPAWVLFENPTGILSLNDGVEFERICLALEGQGYEVQPIAIPACALGAKHIRNRVWVLAHSNQQRLQERFVLTGVPSREGRNDDGENVALGAGWVSEPNVGRVANGIPARMDRLRCLGNAIVPQVAYQLIKRMIEAEAHNEMSLEITTENQHGAVSALIK